LWGHSGKLMRDMVLFDVMRISLVDGNAEAWVMKENGFRTFKVSPDDGAYRRSFILLSGSVFFAFNFWPISILIYPFKELLFPFNSSIRYIGYNIETNSYVIKPYQSEILKIN